MFPANQPAVTPPTRTAKEIFDSPALDKLVGYTGAVNGTTYKYTVGRSDQTITAMGAEMTANIGLLAAGFRTTLNELGKKQNAMKM